ncbi:sialidase family protein [Zobellia nedashkovskayae]|uniref:sialidase family protein n=1 Tax=Zobellia nedashkovskayae TaxID=2779510 RepID=UPI00188D6CC3|nr:hypothetical protein [Zobellia nedashkovskayae]
MTPHSTSLKSTFLILFISTAIFSACKKDVDLESAAYVNETTTVLQDNDGLADDLDPNPFNSDSDGDGIPDGMDVDPDGDGTNDNGTDSDGDGINDVSDVDETGGTDSDADGIDDNVLDPTDNDDDELEDNLDPDPNDPDTDDDGIADGSDVDVDGDGVDDNGTDSDNDGINDNADDDTNLGGIISFRQAGPVGGGYPNVVTWDPNVQGKLYYGSDIGGTGRSTNYGKDFESVGRGLGYEESHQKIAALNAVNVNGSTVIVGGTGFKGTGGEVISSTNGGDTWHHDSSNISFSAQNSNAPLPTGRPRSTDPSLIQWVSGSTWVAGTYKDGVWISTNNRTSWSKLDVFNGNVFVRAMAMSPEDPNTVYVGLWGDDSSIENKGLWQINNLDGNPSASKVSGIPDVVESIVVLGNRMYLACGAFGLRRFVPSNNNLSDITGPIGTSVMSTAVHGVEGTWDTDRIVVGTAEGDGDIWMSEDSGSTWTNTTSSGVAINPWGSNNNLIVFETHGSWALGGSNCDIATIQISPHDPDAWVVCATSAIWTTVDAGATWRPANGFQILTFRDVEINSTGVIAAGNVDHDVVLSIDGGSEWKAVGLGNVTVGHGLTFSPDGSELAFGDGERDNNTDGGKLAVASSPETPSSPELIEVNNPAAPKRIVGVEWINLIDGTERLVAAIDNGGIRTVDRTNGSWSNWNTRTTAFMGAQDNGRLRCSVVSNGGSTIFVYDRKTGVWKSTDYGENWIQILATPAGEDQGYLAFDKANDRLYIATPLVVLRMDDASTSNATTNLSVPTDNPGAIALDPYGRLLVFAEPENVNKEDTALYRNEKPETNDNDWIDIADNTIKRVVPPVTDIDVSAEYIVLVTAGKGMLVSENDAPNP